MAKPIFIVKYPYSKMPQADVNEFVQNLGGNFPDYHTLVIPTENEEFQFECYNSEKANDIDFELLKQDVLALTVSMALNKRSSMIVN